MEVRIINGIEVKLQKKDCVNVVPYGFVNTIDYKKQIKGSAKDLVELGKFSKSLGGITFIGAESDNCGSLRKSVFVFESGKLISICDMNFAEEKHSPSFGYKIVNFFGKKIGVLVDRDLFNPDAVKSLINCGVNAIIDLYEGLLLKKVEVATEFYAYVYGVDFITASKNKTVAFNAFGEVVDFNSECEGCFDFCGVYREIKCKKRGSI